MAYKLRSKTETMFWPNPAQDYVEELEHEISRLTKIDSLRESEYERIHRKLKLAVFDGEEGKDSPTEILVNNLIIAYRGMERGMNIINKSYKP